MRASLKARKNRSTVCTHCPHPLWLLLRYLPRGVLPIEKLSELPNVAQLNPIHAIILVIVSVTLTVIGGLIPASIASKKDPVEALRTE